MYELSIQREFCAAHAITMRGERESLHGHNWHVTTVVQGADLDDDGLLLDFHALERDLDEVLGPFRDKTLNDVAPFDDVNPTAEHLARYVGEAIIERLPDGVELRSVTVTEAPGCAATYRTGAP